MMRAPHRGSGLLEFAVVATVLGVLALLLLDRIAFYRAETERTTVELTIINLRAGLRYRVTELLLQGKKAEIPRLAGGNPLNWLKTRPENYLGERVSPKASEIPPGNWCFDSAAGELIYRVQYPPRPPAGDASAALIRARIARVRGGDQAPIAPTGIDGVLLQVSGNGLR